MTLINTQSLVVLLTGISDQLPDPLFVAPRTHHLVNPTGSAIVVSAVSNVSDPLALPFTDLAGTHVATISVPARGVAIVRTDDGTHWVMHPNNDLPLPMKGGVVFLDVQTDQLFRVELIDDGSSSATWPNRREIMYTGPLGVPARHRVSWDNEFGEGRWTAAKNSTVPCRVYGQDPAGAYTHTANLHEWVDNPTDRNVLAFIATNGAGGGGLAVIEPYPYSIKGALTVQAGTSFIYTEGNYVVQSVRASVGTAPTGAAVIVDVNKNGASIYSATPANRPTIAVGTKTALGGTPDVTTFALGDNLSVDLDQIGSTVAGSDLTVVVRLRRV
jgi:hypothetical protein